MRTPSATDFTINLPKFGDFVFARRTMGDMIKIRSDYLKLIGTNDGDYEMDLFCGFTAAYNTLIVSHPESWTSDLSALDVNAVGLDKVFELSNLLYAKESSFRRVAEV